MSVRSWKGFLPENTVIMVRRSGQPAGVPATPLQEPSANSADPLPSIASITANLKSSLQQSRTESAVKPSLVSGAQSVSLEGRVLIFLESELSAADHEFLLKMLAAINVKDNDIVLEWGDFPEAKCPVALGVGLSTKKSNRLSSLRPDRFELPSLATIQSDAKAKRDAWEMLKLVSGKLKEYL